MTNRRLILYLGRLKSKFAFPVTLAASLHRFWTCSILITWLFPKISHVLITKSCNNAALVLVAATFQFSDLNAKEQCIVPKVQFFASELVSGITFSAFFYSYLIYNTLFESSNLFHTYCFYREKFYSMDFHILFIDGHRQKCNEHRWRIDSPLTEIEEDAMVNRWISMETQPGLVKKISRH